MKFSIIAIFSLIFCLTFSEGQQNPGIQITVTQRGLNLVNRVVLEIVRKKIGKINLPDVIDGKLSLKNLEVTSFSFGSTGFTTRKPNVFSVTISGAEASINGKWRYKKRILFVTTVFHGEIEATASGVNIKQDITLARDSDGKPTFGVGRCTASVGGFHVKVKKAGVLTFLFNLVLKLFKNKIKKTLEGKICPAIGNVLRKEASKLTQEINVRLPFAFGTNIDLGLVSNPVATGNSFTASVNGTSYPRNMPAETFPFSPPALPPVPPATSMIRILLSDYVLNTLLFSMWEEGRLNGSLKFSQLETLSDQSLHQDFPESMLQNFKASKSFSQEMNEEFHLQLAVGAPSAPVAEFNSSGITIYGPFVLTAKSTTNSADIISLRLNVKISGRFVVNGNIILGNITNIDIEVTGGSGYLPTVIINDLLKPFLRDLILPVLNSVASSGFKLPSYFDYKFNNLALHYQKHAVEICSDFAHD